MRIATVQEAGVEESEVDNSYITPPPPFFGILRARYLIAVKRGYCICAGANLSAEDLAKLQNEEPVLVPVRAITSLLSDETPAGPGDEARELRCRGRTAMDIPFSVRLGIATQWPELGFRLTPPNQPFQRTRRKRRAPEPGRAGHK